MGVFRVDFLGILDILYVVKQTPRNKMKSYSHYACAFDSEVYCNSCLLDGASVDSQAVGPIFADSEWDDYPVCCKCGEIHDYVVKL